MEGRSSNEDINIWPRKYIKILNVIYDLDAEYVWI